MKKQPRLEPKVDWEKSKLTKQYAGWTKFQKEIYKYWLDLAKEYEKEPLEAARFAAYKARTYGCKT